MWSDCTCISKLLNLVKQIKFPYFRRLSQTEFALKSIKIKPSKVLVEKRKGLHCRTHTHVHIHAWQTNCINWYSNDVGKKWRSYLHVHTCDTQCLVGVNWRKQRKKHDKRLTIPGFIKVSCAILMYIQSITKIFMSCCHM